MKVMKVKKFILAFASTVALVWLPVNAEAATTGLDFAGGCPEMDNGVTALCDNGGNADMNNVAAILGVNTSLVSEVIGGFNVTGIGFTDGDWSVTDTSITHIAFKSATYFILGEVNALGGTWDNNDWDLTLVTCPDTICTAGPRAYTWDDFTNNGGNIAALSNVRAFSVVPVPAAVWLFGSGLLGLVGIARRKRA